MEGRIPYGSALSPLESAERFGAFVPCRFEPPTRFYAICLVPAMLGPSDDTLSLWLAWAYVLIRNAHSPIQATVNAICWRSRPFSRTRSA